MSEQSRSKKSKRGLRNSPFAKDVHRLIESVSNHKRASAGIGLAMLALAGLYEADRFTDQPPGLSARIAFLQQVDGVGPGLYIRHANLRSTPQTIDLSDTSNVTNVIGSINPDKPLKVTGTLTSSSYPGWSAFELPAGKNSSAGSNTLSELAGKVVWVNESGLEQFQDAYETNPNGNLVPNLSGSTLDNVVDVSIKHGQVLVTDLDGTAVDKAFEQSEYLKP